MGLCRWQVTVRGIRGRGQRARTAVCSRTMLMVMGAGRPGDRLTRDRGQGAREEEGQRNPHTEHAMWGVGCDCYLRGETTPLSISTHRPHNTGTHTQEHAPTTAHTNSVWCNYYCAGTHPLPTQAHTPHTHQHGALTCKYNPLTLRLLLSVSLKTLMLVCPSRVLPK